MPFCDDEVLHTVSCTLPVVLKVLRGLEFLRQSRMRRLKGAQVRVPDPSCRLCH